MRKLKNNRQRLSKIKPAQTLRHLLFLGLGVLSWLGFSYLFLLYVKLGQSRSLYKFPWHYDAPIWAFKECLIGAVLLIAARRTFGLLTEKSKSLLRDFTILTLLIPVNSLLITAYYTLIVGVTYSDTGAVEYDLVMGFLHCFVLQTFVAMTCVGYFYLTLVNQTKEKLSAAQQAKTAMELKTLRQNIEPHFLFNNLNVLSALIESSPPRANEFLSKMSEIYRYILQSQTQEFVSLKEELEFVENYIFLLKERFGAAYDFDWQIAEKDLNGQMIVPVSLQSLIENAVKHNAGNPENPLRIKVKLEEKYLSVENELREKPQTFQTSRSGLQNLQSRYSFLTEKPLEITRGDRIFKVKLPLLYAE